MRLWWLGAGSPDLRALDLVRSHLERLFGVTTLPEPVHERPDGAFDARRGQHSSTRILAWMAARLPDDASRALGLTDVDLFVPVLSFVFGEAQLGGRTAVVSTARLAGSPPAAAPRSSARLAKEAAHELGHTFGLLHCGSPRCVMSRSASLIDVDGKDGDLCHDCRVRLADRRRAPVGTGEG